MDWTKLDYEKVVNLIFCVSILMLGFKRWRSEGVRAFILVGLGFTLFGLSHLSGILGAQGVIGIETMEQLKSGFIWGRGLGYVLVLVGMLV